MALQKSDIVQGIDGPTRRQWCVPAHSSAGRPARGGPPHNLKLPHSHCFALCSASRTLSFAIGETSVAFPLPAEEAARLSAALGGVLQTFADKQKAERPKRWPSMEFKFKGRQLASYLLLC